MTFEALYRTYHADVLRFALYLSGSYADAEDIASETFVRAWASDAPAKARTLRAYLFTIARNLNLRRLQRGRRETPLDSELVDVGIDLQAELESRQALKATLAQLSTLPEIDRSALLMRAFHGFSYDEIASALKITVAAARVKVHRARQALQKE